MNSVHASNKQIFNLTCNILYIISYQQFLKKSALSEVTVTFEDSDQVYLKIDSIQQALKMVNLISTQLLICQKSNYLHFEGKCG